MTSLHESTYNQEPEDLAPIVASLIGRVIKSLTKSGKPWGWWAEFQRRVQTGENAGQFAEMGGLGLSKVRNSQGKVSSEIFTYIGPSNDGPTYGKFLITGSANIPDGVYHLPMEKVDLGVKAKLSEEYLQRIGAETQALPSDPGLIIDINGVTRDDASQEDVDNSNRKLEPLPNLDKMAAKREKTQTTYSELTPGDLVFDEGDDVYGLVVSNDENGIWVRWQNKRISQVPTKNIDRPVFVWKQSEQEATLDKMAARKKKDEPVEDGIAPEEPEKPRSGSYKVKDLQKGDSIIFDDGQMYSVLKNPVEIKGSPGFYRLTLRDEDNEANVAMDLDQDVSYQVVPPKPADEVVAPPEEDLGPTKRTTVDSLDAGNVLFDIATGQEYTFVSASLEPDGKNWYVVVKDADDKTSVIKIPKSSIVKQKMELKEGNTRYTPIKNTVSRKEVFESKKPAIDRYNKISALYGKNTEAIKSLPDNSQEAQSLLKLNATIETEMDKIESEMKKAGFKVEEYYKDLSKTESTTDVVVEDEKIKIAEGIDYDVYDDGVMVVFGKDYWNNVDLLKQAAALFRQSGAGSVVLQYHGKGKDPKNPNYFRDLKRASHSLSFDIKKGTVEDAVKFIAENLKRLYEERQSSGDVSDETENFSGKPGTRGDLENGVSFEITSDGVIHFKGNLDKNEAAFDWLMFDAKDAVPAHDTSLAEDDSEYTTSVLSRSDADRAKLIEALNKKLNPDNVGDDTGSIDSVVESIKTRDGKKLTQQKEDKDGNSVISYGKSEGSSRKLLIKAKRNDDGTISYSLSLKTESKPDENPDFTNTSSFDYLVKSSGVVKNSEDLKATIESAIKYYDNMFDNSEETYGRFIESLPKKDRDAVKNFLASRPFDPLTDPTQEEFDKFVEQRDSFIEMLMTHSIKEFKKLYDLETSQGIKEAETHFAEVLGFMVPELSYVFRIRSLNDLSTAENNNSLTKIRNTFRKVVGDLENLIVRKSSGKATELGKIPSTHKYLGDVSPKDLKIGDMFIERLAGKDGKFTPALVTVTGLSPSKDYDDSTDVTFSDGYSTSLNNKMEIQDVFRSKGPVSVVTDDAVIINSTSTKPALNTKEYWDWIKLKVKEGKITQADLKEAINLAFDISENIFQKTVKEDVAKVLKKFFDANPDGTKGQALEFLKNSTPYIAATGNVIRELYTSIFGDNVNKAVFKNREKKSNSSGEKLFEDEFNAQIESFVSEIGEKPVFKLEDPESNKPYWKWLKQQIEAGTLSEEDRVEAIANVRDSTIDMALVDSLQSLETILRKLIDEDPNITRAEARKKVKEIFSDFATAVMMDPSRVKYFGEDFVNSREYRTAIVAAQRDINDSLMRNLTSIIGDFIPLKRPTTTTTATKESYSASASEVKIGDRIYVPGTDKKKSATVINSSPISISGQKTPWVRLSLQDSDGNISVIDVRPTAQIDIIGKKPVVTETTETETETEEEEVEEETSAPTRALPIPADISELDFTGMSDEDKRLSIKTLLLLEEIGRNQEKLPAGEFPGWGQPYEPKFKLSEADIAWAKDEENAPILQVLRDQLEQLGVSDTEKQKLLRLVRQMPLNEARQAVLNIIESNPLLETEFYKRAANLGDILKNLKALSEKEKIPVPKTLKNVSDIIPDGEKTDLSKSYTFEEFLEDKYPNIPLSDLVNLPKHEKRIARERKLYDAWMDENKKRIYDQVFEMDNVQIRYSSKGKVTKKAFALLSQVMKVVNDITPPGGSKVKVTLADPEWMKEITGSDRTKGFTTFDESGINIVISERMFGQIKQKEEDGVDTQIAPFIGEFLKQYGVALYGSVVGAGFKADKSATELEEIFKNKFDINKKSNGAIEFGEMFRDFFADRLNDPKSEKFAEFGNFVVRAVNTGYRPTINLTNALDLDGKEVLMQTGQRRARSAGFAGAKELKGEALKKYEETRNSLLLANGQQVQVRWLEGLPTFRDSSGTLGTLPDKVDKKNWRKNASFMRFVQGFVGDGVEATNDQIDDLIEAFNKTLSKQRKETERMRVVRVDGTNATIRWKESDFDNDQDARKTLNSVIKQIKQMNQIDSLGDFPISVTLSKKDKFTPGGADGVLFTSGKGEDWTGYKYVTEDGAFIVLDIDQRKINAGVDGNWAKDTKNKELDNRLLQDLGHEYGHLVLELRTGGNNKNDRLFQQFVNLG